MSHHRHTVTLHLKWIEPKVLVLKYSKVLKVKAQNFAEWPILEYEQCIIYNNTHYNNNACVDCILYRHSEPAV